jgi:hypothetical protein
MGRADEIGAPRVVGGQGHDERCGEGERHGARDGRPPGQGGRWSGKTRKRRPKNRSMALRLPSASAVQGVTRQRDFTANMPIRPCSDRPSSSPLPSRHVQEQETPVRG